MDNQKSIPKFVHVALLIVHFTSEVGALCTTVDAIKTQILLSLFQILMDFDTDSNGNNSTLYLLNLASCESISQIC